MATKRTATRATATATTTSAMATPLSLHWKYEIDFEDKWLHNFHVTAATTPKSTTLKSDKNEVGTMKIQVIQRSRIADEFYSIMDGPSHELMQFAEALFTCKGKLKKTLRTNKLWTLRPLHDKGDLIFIDDIRVNKEYQRQGVCGRMMKQAMSELLAQPSSKQLKISDNSFIFLQVVPYNDAGNVDMSRDSLKLKLIKIVHALGFGRLGKTEYFAAPLDGSLPDLSLETSERAEIKTPSLSAIEQNVVHHVGNPTFMKIFISTATPDALNRLNVLHRVMGIMTSEASALQERMDILLLCIKAGINVNGRDENGLTPLHVAAAVKQHKAVSLLLQHGADKTLMDSEGKSPYDMMIEEADQSTQFINDIFAGANQNVPDHIKVEQAREKRETETMLLLLKCQDS